jgi:hypothetical protein
LTQFAVKDPHEFPINTIKSLGTRVALIKGKLEAKPERGAEMKNYFLISAALLLVLTAVGCQSASMATMPAQSQTVAVVPTPTATPFPEAP